MEDGTEILVLNVDTAPNFDTVLGDQAEIVVAKKKALTFVSPRST